VAKKACKYTVKFVENGTDSISLRKKRAAETMLSALWKPIYIGYYGVFC
jgi:hypothetical protein